MICHLSAHKQTILFPRFIFLTIAPHNTCLHISIPPGSRIILPDHQRPVHSSTPPNLQRVATVPRLGRSGQKELEAYLRLEFQVSFFFFFFFYCSTNVFSIRLHVREGEDGCRHQQRRHLGRHGHHHHHRHQHHRHHRERGLETQHVSSRYCKFF